MMITPLEAHFRTYTAFLRHHFGAPLFRVSIDAGFSCPNRDGTLGREGCIYCNNKSFSPQRAESTIPALIEKELEKRRRAGSEFIVYFQSFTNTHADLRTLRRRFEEALSVKGCAGLAIGTRPDCVDEEKLAYLEELAGRYFITIEYGLQSPYLQSLEWMKRGHDFECFRDAVRLTRGRKIFIGAHIILGIPGETHEMMLNTACEVSRLPIDFLKIHQLQVVRDTPLAAQFELQPFALWRLDEYADFLCDFIEMLRSDMVVQRLYSYSRSDLLIGPVWGSRQEIDRVIHGRLRSRGVIQGRRTSQAATILL